MKPLRAVQVDWEDCYQSTEQYTDGEPIEPRMMQAVGWLVLDNDKYVVLGVDWDELGEVWRGFQVIPKGIVRNVVPLKFPVPD